jgi:hypothetical protein
MTTEQAYELVKELRQLQLRQYEIEVQLKQFVKDKFQSERQFREGEIVDCFDDNGNKKDQGIIEGGRIYIDFDSHRVKRYCEDPECFCDDLNNFRYGVKKIKKDGTKSNRNISYSRSYSTNSADYGWYIRKKQTQPA